MTNEEFNALSEKNLNALDLLKKGGLDRKKTKKACDDIAIYEGVLIQIINKDNTIISQFSALFGGKKDEKEIVEATDKRL